MAYTFVDSIDLPRLGGLGDLLCARIPSMVINGEITQASLAIS